MSLGKRTPVLLAALIASAALAVPAASAAPGGFSPRAEASAEAPPPAETPPAEAPPTAEAPPSGLPAPPPVVPGAAAALVGDRAVAPASAPPAVKRAIAAANRIRTTPYIWGGGHGGWWDRGYDCSGAVSYALHGGTLLEAPLVSGSFMSWGEPGPGSWITIYANRAHVYAVIAGLRWDTGGDAPGVTGPRWHTDMASARGFVIRHPAGY